MLYMALCGEYVLFEKFWFSGCCGGRESLSDTIGLPSGRQGLIIVTPTITRQHT